MDAYDSRVHDEASAFGRGTSNWRLLEMSLGNKGTLHQGALFFFNDQVFFSLHDYNHSHYDLDDCKNVYTAIERMLKSLNTQMLYQEERRENEVSQ